VIDHFNLPVADLELSGAFYRRVLAALASIGGSSGGSPTQ
jgi:predicted lactoylglutathione lyase